MKWTKEAKWALRSWLSVIAVVTLLILVSSPALADTTADVTVTATGKFVSITDNTTTYDFGQVAASSTTNTSLQLVLITNTSSVATNATISVTTNVWTSAGAGDWTHSDSAAAANTAAMKAQSNNVSAVWGTGDVFVKFTGPSQIIDSVAANSNWLYGLSLLAPTDFTDGQENSIIVRITAYASS